MKNDLGDIDILVNNAGIVTGKKFLECPDSLIQKTMDVNASAHFWVGRSYLELHCTMMIIVVTVGLVL